MHWNQITCKSDSSLFVYNRRNRFESDYSAAAANTACFCEHENSIDPSFWNSQHVEGFMHPHESFKDTKMSHFYTVLLFLLPVQASFLNSQLLSAVRHGLKKRHINSVLLK